MSRFYKMVLGAILLLALTRADAEQSNWVLSKNIEGIKVYTRKVAGSLYREFKGITQIKTRLSACIALINDVGSYPNWFYEVPIARIISKSSDLEGYNYMVYNLPWPLTDRDIVIHYSGKTDNLTYVQYELQAAPFYVKPIDKLIRVTSLSGHWRFTRHADSIVEVEYQLHIDPNGEVPSWLANAVVVDAPYNTLLRFKAEITKPKNASATYKWLKEEL